MIKNVRYLLVCSLISIGCIIGSNAQSRSTISGYVFDTNRNPVSEIPVELLNDFNSVVARTRTDGGGRFRFSGLGQGRFTIRVLPLGTDLVEQSGEVEIAGIGARGQPLSDNVQRDFYLKARRSAGAVPFKNAVVYAQEVPKDAEAHYKEGVSDLNSGRLQTGIASLEKAITIFPGYFAALQQLGVVRLGEGKFEEAADLFKRALAVNDRGFDSWYGLAYAAYTLRKFSDAVAASEKAVSLRTDSMEANLLLGMSSRVVKNFENAEKALVKAAKIAEGSSPDVHWQLALLYGKDTNRYSEAAKELEKYLALSPDAPNKEEVKKLIKQFKEKAKSTN